MVSPSAATCSSTWLRASSREGRREIWEWERRTGSEIWTVAVDGEAQIGLVTARDLMAGQAVVPSGSAVAGQRFSTPDPEEDTVLMVRRPRGRAGAVVRGRSPAAVEWSADLVDVGAHQGARRGTTATFDFFWVFVCERCRCAWLLAQDFVLLTG
ncbi:ER membrane protein complex subunit 8/9-like protein [Iris pallida]|uniref:ER membrane protein complex subunit 8/9-like protein n=1 Tax=Iris pallida TaxID=29817 RepID=A0AAX6FWW9_IRIPA|nr:ER membrane protein complex subunit 8/9-like protein [Iris pallida]